ncbi:cobalt-precorrin 5A hydrolase [Methanosphaerula subterraneus]|uniref:cobalt-precorrin 5A hydrolase n=1 Tax=Methanosphaerula subterraneus TaxID=3350244 RepID=UPI003F867E8E
MTSTVVIALPRFNGEAATIARVLDADRRDYTNGVFAEVWGRYSRIVAVMSAGIVVRQVAPLLKDKWQDPAVVVVSPDLKYAVPLVGGHHGANDLAKQLGEAGLLPVLTTATESLGLPSVEGIAAARQCDVVNRPSTRTVNAAILERDVPVYRIDGPAIVVAGPAVSFLVASGEYVVGIGCRRGVTAQEVQQGVEDALSVAGIAMDDVRCYATTVQKRDETGLVDGVFAMGGDLIFLDDQTINAESPPSSSGAGRIGLVGVAEPAALALSTKREMILKKKVYGRVTIAIAR